MRPGFTSTKRGEWYDSTFARNLRALIEHEADGRELAWCAAHGLPQSTVTRLSTGVVTPRLDTAQRIADKTRYSLSQLLDNEFRPGVSPPQNDAWAQFIASRSALIESPVDRARLEAIVEQFVPVGHEPQPAVSPANHERQPR